MVKAGLGLAAAPTPGRRIFASRAGSERRRLINRREVEAAFAAAGFDIVDPGELGYREQAQLFHDADVVVGEHGANLSNLGFCRPGTLVCELFHPRKNMLCYVSFAEALGLLHRSIVGVAESEDAWSLDPAFACDLVKAAVERREIYFDGLSALKIAEYKAFRNRK